MSVIVFDENGTGVASNGMNLEWWVADNVLVIRPRPMDLHDHVQILVRSIRFLPTYLAKLEIIEVGTGKISLRSSSGNIVTLTRRDD